MCLVSKALKSCPKFDIFLFFSKGNISPFLSHRLRFLTFGLILSQLVFISLAAAAETVGNAFPANGGYTGLLDMPTARLIPDWNMRTYYTRADPYATYGVTVGVLPWLEVNGRVTRISGLPALSSNYGDYKDKAIDVKLKLLDETDVLAGARHRCHRYPRYRSF